LTTWLLRVAVEVVGRAIKIMAAVAARVVLKMLMDLP
jgi:hypothetical protein